MKKQRTEAEQQAHDHEKIISRKMRGLKTRVKNQCAEKSLLTTDIEWALRSYYSSHQYTLNNSYVFMWESDHFSIAKGGIVYEVEIKVSRSDFKADFKKTQKHKMLSDKKEFTVIPGMEMVEYETREEWEKRTENKDPYGYYQEKKRTVTGNYIRIVKNLIPHRFYYATPVGLIDKSELPPYAGLLEIGEKRGLKRRKLAPKLHDRELDLHKVLLDKFYYKAEDLRQRLEMARDDLRRLNGLTLNYDANDITLDLYDTRKEH